MVESSGKTRVWLLEYRVQDEYGAEWELHEDCFMQDNPPSRAPHRYNSGRQVLEWQAIPFYLMHDSESSSAVRVPTPPEPNHGGYTDGFAG